MEKNYFEVAARNKFRFETKVGCISTEELFDLPLKANNGVDLDSVARKINSQIKAEEQESFVETKTTQSTLLSDMLEVVKSVIAIKLEEKKAKETAAENSAKRKRILEALARKQEEGINAMSEAELLAELETL